MRDPARRGCILGFALLYAWNLMSAADPGVLAPEPAREGLLMVGVTSLSNMVGYLLVAFVLSARADFGRIATVGAVVGCAASFVALAVAYGAVSAAWATVACRVVVRLCTAAVTVAWLMRFVALGASWITPCCLAGFLGAVLLGVCGLAFSGIGKQVVHALLPVASMAVYRLSPAGDGEVCPAAPQAARRFAASVWRVLLVFFAFGVVNWAVSIGSNAPSGGVTSAATFVATFAVLGALLVGALVTRLSFSLSYVNKVVVPLVFAGLMVLVGAGAGSVAGVVLVQTGYSCFDVFCLATIAVAIARSGVRAGAAFGVCRAIECSAPFCALVVMALFGGEDIVPLLAAASAFLLFVLAIVDGAGVFESGENAPAENLPRVESMLFALQCERAVRDFGLTPREGEVMSLIARGRSIPHISGRLGISRSTAKTYVARIYEKMGVCERQGMLDRIESLAVEGEG